MLLDDLGGNFCFQTFDDSKDKKGSLVKVLHGNLADHESILKSLNEKGAGIYFTVNETDGSGRKAQNINRIRALFVDLDDPDPNREFNWFLSPSYVIETSPGKHHCYWLLSDELPIDEFAPLMKSLAYIFDGDPTVCDLPRVMRVPGFYHNKGEPFLVQEIINNNRRYTAEELRNWIFSFDDLIERTSPQTLPKPVKEPSSIQVEPYSQDDPFAIVKFEHQLEELSQAVEGERNTTLNKIAYMAYRLVKAGRLAKGFVDGELLSIALNIGLPANEIKNTLRSAFNASKLIHNDIDLLPDLSDEHIRIANSEPPHRFKLLSRGELINLPKQRWLVKGVLPEQGLACIYGASGTGKSFLALDIGFCVSSGREWFGLKTMAAPVTYVCLEGQSGIKKRITALENHRNELIPDNFKIIADRLNIEKDVDALAQSIIAQNGKGGLIIIDTFAQAAPGIDENSGKDMSLIIKALQKLQNINGGLVLLIAHAGKDPSRKIRGHSSLYAALDACIEVTKPNSIHHWNLSKSKDDIDGCKFSFKLQSIVIDIDEGGLAITSCAISRNAKEVSLKKPPKSGNMLTAWNKLQEMSLSKEPNENGIIKIPFGEAVEQISKKLGCAMKDRIRRTNEAINRLARRGLITIQEELLWLTQ